MKIFYSLILILSCVFLVHGQEVAYNFNALSEGDLDGQDDWNTILNIAGPHDLFVAYTAGGVASPDGSLAVYYTGSGGGYGRNGTRKASSNFNFNLTESDIIELEIDMHRNYWGMYFGVGFDADGDGYIVPGLDSEPNDGGIYLQLAGNNPESNNKMVLPDGNSVIYTADNGGWCRYKMVLDFTAFDGQGAVALSYDPGITGEWISIAEVQGINMGLTIGSGDKRDRTVWDGLFINATGGNAGFDNILIRQLESQGEAQYIDFPSIDNMLTTHPPFELQASASSGLAVEYAVVEGPVSLEGSMITLTGEPGIVTITANQAGDNTWAPAPEVTQSFEVVDATAYSPELTIRRPVEGPKVYMEELSSILIVASAYIDHPEVLNILNVSYDIEGQGGEMTEKSWGTGYYSGEWTPTAYGSYSMAITVESTGGMSTTSYVTFEITDDIVDLNVQAFDQVHISTSTETTVTQNFIFPTYVGAFDQIIAYLDVTCPGGGCDAWDRVGNMYAKAPTGEWIEIIRYITPYGVPCDHSIAVTDYSSIFQGLVEMRFSIGTDAQGFIVDVNLDFQAGTPPYKYSWVNKLWDKTYPFGDYANLQPVEPVIWNFETITQASKLKIFNTGHGWGPSNSGNAAEFYEATHRIGVNNDEFDQHLWVQCNPNPDGCQPQNGTWYYNRAGWCPGSIGYMYEYDLSPYVNSSDVEISYTFYENYVDYCHPNHPDCVSGVSCEDCNAGFNPHYIISGNLVSYGDQLHIPLGEIEENYYGLQLTPNPSRYRVLLSTNKKNLYMDAQVQVFNVSGQLLNQFKWQGEDLTIDVSQYPDGLYFVNIESENHKEVKRLIVE